MTKVFVYGSLKAGLHNHHFLESSNFIGKDSIEGFRMVSLGAYPGIIPSGDSLPPIKGEVYEVGLKTMQDLDRLEGHPHYYCRHKVRTVETGDEVWVYILSDDERFLSRETVPDGEWRPKNGTAL